MMIAHEKKWTSVKQIMNSPVQKGGGWFLHYDVIGGIQGDRWFVAERNGRYNVAYVDDFGAVCSVRAFETLCDAQAWLDGRMAGERIASRHLIDALVNLGITVEDLVAAAGKEADIPEEKRLKYAGFLRSVFQ